MNWGMRRRVPDDLRSAKADPSTIPDQLKRVIGRKEVTRSYGSVSHAQAVVKHRVEMAAVDRLFAEARLWLAGQGIEVRHVETGGLPVVLPQVMPTLADCRATILSWFYVEEGRRLARPMPDDPEEREAALDGLRADDAALAGERGRQMAERVLFGEDMHPRAAAAPVSGIRRLRTEGGAPGILASAGFATPSGDVRRLAVEIMHRAMAESVVRQLLRYGETTSPPDVTLSAITIASPPPPAPTARLTFGALIDRYLAAPERAGLSPKTVLKYKAFSRVLKEIVGETKTASSVDRAEARRVQDVLLALPPNAVKRWPGLTASQAAEKAKAAGIEPMHPNSVTNHLEFLAAVYGFGVREQLVEKNPASGLNTSTAKGVTASASGKKRRPFTTEELTAIFSAPLYAGCQDDGNGYDKPGPNRPRRGRFWVPLLCLFGGLRLNEACQIRVADVVTVDGVHLIQVRAEGEGARLKTAAAERPVPVHPELVRLGFLQHVEQQRKAGEDRLFPDLPLGKMGTYADPFSKWFGRFLTKAKVTAPNVVFHSFRHGWRTRLDNAERSNKEIADRLGGWVVAGEGSAYGSGFSAPVLAKHLAQVTYPGLDLSHLYMAVQPMGQAGDGQEAGAAEEQAPVVQVRHRVQSRRAQQPVEAPQEITVTDTGEPVEAPAQA